MAKPLRQRPSQQGFTLVEIAIVLVIIGLLLGGILKGQEMITQARIKNVINDFNGITAAYFGYQDRYRAVPGDDGNAHARWGATGSYGALNGDNNGVISGNYNAHLSQAPAVAFPAPGAAAVTTARESEAAWAHLRAAGFVAGAASGIGSHTPPQNALGGPVGLQNRAWELPGNVICSANVSDKIAGSVDGQLDDLRANAGTMRGALLAADVLVPPLTAAPTATYVETGSNVYVVCRTI